MRTRCCNFVDRRIRSYKVVEAYMESRALVSTSSCALATLATFLAEVKISCRSTELSAAKFILYITSTMRPYHFANYTKQQQHPRKWRRLSISGPPGFLCSSTYRMPSVQDGFGEGRVLHNQVTGPRRLILPSSRLAYPCRKPSALFGGTTSVEQQGALVVTRA